MKLDNIYDLKSAESIILYILIVFIISFFATKILRFILKRRLKKKLKDMEDSETGINFFKNSIKFFVYTSSFLVIMISIPSFRDKASYIFSGAGILAAIIGFAAQSAISNLIAGVFIVIFKPFRVGDFIKLDTNRMGVVQDITMRHTVINNFENKRLIIPNSMISTESVFNHTIEDSKILTFNSFKIGLKADIDKAKKIIEEEALKMEYTIDNRSPQDILANKPQVRLRCIEVNEIFINLRALVWINDPFKEFEFKSLLRESVHKRFIKEKIELPTPIMRLNG